MSCSFRSWLLAATLLPAPLAAQVPDDLHPQLQERALASNAALVAARSSVRTLEARLAGAGARAAPALALEIDEVPGGAEFWNAGNVQLALEQELFGGFRRQRAGAVASAELAQRQLEVRLLERRARVDVTRAYTRWIGARLIIERIRLEDELLQDVERGLNSRFAVGEARYVDVLRVRTERLQVQSERATIRRDASEAREQLIALVGDTTGLSRQLDAIDQSPQLPPAPASLPPVDSLLRELHELGAFSLRQAEAEALTAQERAERGMRLTAGAGIQRFGEQGDFSIGPTLRLGATLPFAVPGSNRAVVHAAQAREQQAVAEDVALLQQARSRIAIAHTRFRAAREQADLFDTALLAGSRSERDAALASYRTGSLSLIELLDFERSLARAEIAHLRALLEVHEAWADLLAPASLEGDHRD